jgi:hypothetical protein
MRPQHVFRLCTTLQQPTLLSVVLSHVRLHSCNAAATVMQCCSPYCTVAMCSKVYDKLSAKCVYQHYTHTKCDMGVS